MELSCRAADVHSNDGDGLEFYGTRKSEVGTSSKVMDKAESKWLRGAGLGQSASVNLPGSTPELPGSEIL